ncbi:hypothetical protein RHGRI_007005 [Rhododendron griersonianum]|uniref:Uncharacterized protein n=1 Tax=Rhododendron griersonianum TaxID=479676 RepID=A0AAV6KWE0_9ERIC|nr:hypothetical protein RHGRI_007005 [Rhododendron griersonianum]
MDIRGWRNKEALLRVLYALFLGQVVSFVMAIMAFTASFIADLGVDTPLTLSFFSYLALALVYLGIGMYSWVLSMSKAIILFCGAALCIAGLGLVLISDAGVGSGGGSKPLLGDLLVIGGTFFYAMSNVGEEFCVKKKDRVEVVSMIGLFGTLVSVCQMYPLFLFSNHGKEDSGISTMVCRNCPKRELFVSECIYILTFAGYAFASFMFYTLVPFVLQVDWLYYLSFAIVVVGLVIYSKTEKDPVSIPALENRNVPYQVLGEEGVESRNETIAS